VVGTTGLLVSRSRDGGATWQNLGTATSGPFCHMSVDPTDPRDVALADGNPFIDLGVMA
jgi:hypothetical protein